MAKTFNMRFPYTYLVITFLLISPALLYAADVEDLIRKAETAVEQHKYQTALIHLKNAAKKKKDDLTIRLELARIYLLTGQGVQATVEIDKAERLGAKPQQTILLNLKAKFYQGEFDKITQNRDLIGLPQELIASVRAIQGHAFYAQRQFEQASSMFERAILLAPEALEAQLGQIKLAKLKGLVQQQEGQITRLLRVYPNNAEVLLQAGNFYREREQFDKSLELLKRAGKIQLANIDIWFAIVRSHIGKGNLASAKTEIQKILAGYPEHQVANYLLAVIAFQENDLARAKSAAEIVLKGKKRNFEALKLLGTIQFHQKDYSLSETNLLKYLKSHPDDFQARKTLASVYLKRQQGTKALELLKGFENSNDAHVMSLLAIASGQVGNAERKSYYIKQATRIAPEDNSIKRQLQMSRLEDGESLDIAFTDTSYENFLYGGHIPILNLMRLKKYDEALQIISGYQQNMPENGLLHYLEGSVYSSQGKFEQAKNSFTLSIEKSPNLIDAYISLARIYQTQGNDKRAEGIYRRVLNIERNNDQAMVALAGIYSRKNDEAEMLKWLKLSRQRNTASLASREVLEKYYRSNGNTTKALELVEEMVRIQPENTALLKRLADNQHAIGKTDIAVETYKKIVKLDPNSASSWYGLGRLQSIDEDYLEAEKSFLKVLELEPKSIVPKVVLIKLDLQFNRLKAARLKAKQMVKQHPEIADSYEMMGDVHIAQGNTRSAIRSYQQSVKLEYDPQAYLKLFSAYQKNNQLVKGMELLTKWVDDNPEDMMLAEALAYTYQKQHKYEQANAVYEKIIQKVRNNDRILNNMALVSLALNSPMSLEYADLAYNINPKHPSNIDTLGWVLLKNNNVNESLKFLKTAVESAPGNPDIRYRYAVALNESSKHQEAVKQLYLSVATEGEFINREAAKKLLAKLTK